MALESFAGAPGTCSTASSTHVAEVLGWMPCGSRAGGKQPGPGAWKQFFFFAVFRRGAFAAQHGQDWAQFRLMKAPHRTVHVSNGRPGRFLSDRMAPVPKQLAASRDYVWAKEVRSAP